MIFIYVYYVLSFFMFIMFDLYHLLFYALIGGIACGTGFPQLYTRIVHYKKWISCILEKSDEHNFEKVSEICKETENRRNILEERCQNNVEIYDCLHGGNDEINDIR